MRVNRNPSESRKFIRNPLENNRKPLRSEKIIQIHGNPIKILRNPRKPVKSIGNRSKSFTIDENPLEFIYNRLKKNKGNAKKNKEKRKTKETPRINNKTSEKQRKIQ